MSKEEGRDYANEEMGFAEGAAGVLREKGKTVGQSAGHGVADLVKGASVNDVAHAPVKVTVAPELATAGLHVLQAHEGGIGEAARQVVVNLEFLKAYEGRLQSRAFASADGSKEIARSAVSKGMTQAAGSTAEVVFEFSGQSRLSQINHGVLTGLAAKAAGLEHGLAGSGLALSQLTEAQNQVTLYVVFARPYRGGLQLRAYADDGRELECGEPTAKLSQSRDTASYVGFDFDTKTPLGDATRYVVYKSAPKTRAKPW